MIVSPERPPDPYKMPGERLFEGSVDVLEQFGAGVGFGDDRVLGGRLELFTNET
jgi:hypothetical protein